MSIIVVNLILFRRGITRRSAARTRKRYGRPRTKLGVKSRLTRPAACWTSAARPARSTSSPKGSSLVTIPYCRASVGVIIKALAARKYRLRHYQKIIYISELLFNIFYRRCCFRQILHISCKDFCEILRV